jgi:hypothetical protein
MKHYVMLVEYVTYVNRSHVYTAPNYEKVTKRENYSTDAYTVETAIDRAKTWCRQNRKPFNGEVTVTNIYSEETH